MIESYNHGYCMQRKKTAPHENKISNRSVGSRTGVFLRFLDERKARGKRGARVTRDGKVAKTLVTRGQRSSSR